MRSLSTVSWHEYSDSEHMIADAMAYGSLDIGLEYEQRGVALSSQQGIDGGMIGGEVE